SIASFPSKSPAGSPETIATSAGPCDSPAVASSSVMWESLEPRKDSRDEARLPVPRRGEEEAAEPTCLVGVERDRGLGLLATPHAQTRVLRLRQIDGHAEAAVADVGVPAEVLDDLRPLRLAAVRAEAELVLHSHPACTAAAHRARSIPSAASGQADGLAHRAERRGATRPELEARGALRDEHLETVEDARSRGCRRLRRGRSRVREVD